MLKIFCSPSRYVQGREATRQLAPELLRMGLANARCSSSAPPRALRPSRCGVRGSNRRA
ncbi:MAG: hypothetical protein MZU84_02580 [Sphingobacterium sp.]|nr:hypothetical protein [Sphingobacterium sp.]